MIKYYMGCPICNLRVPVDQMDCHTIPGHRYDEIEETRGLALLVPVDHGDVCSGSNQPADVQFLEDGDEVISTWHEYMVKIHNVQVDSVKEAAVIADERIEEETCNSVFAELDEDGISLSPFSNDSFDGIRRLDFPFTRAEYEFAIADAWLEEKEIN